MYPVTSKALVSSERVRRASNSSISVVAGRRISDMLFDFVVLLLSLVDYAHSLALGARDLTWVTNFDAGANAYKVLDVFF